MTKGWWVAIGCRHEVMRTKFVGRKHQCAGCKCGWMLQLPYMDIKMANGEESEGLQSSTRMLTHENEILVEKKLTIHVKY